LSDQPIDELRDRVGDPVHRLGRSELNPTAQQFRLSWEKQSPHYVWRRCEHSPAYLEWNL